MEFDGSHQIANLRPEEYKAREELREIFEHRGLTLDGQPAGIFGLKMRFATVRALKNSGLSARYEWPTLEVIAAHGHAALST